MDEILGQPMGLADNHRQGLREYTFLPSTSGSVRNREKLVKEQKELNKSKQNNKSCERLQVKLTKQFSNQNTSFINGNMHKDLDQLSQNNIQRCTRINRKPHIISSTAKQAQRSIYLIRSHLQLIASRVNQFQTELIQSKPIQSEINLGNINADLLTRDQELQSSKLKKLHKLVRLIKIAQKFAFQTQFQPKQIEMQNQKHLIQLNYQHSQIKKLKNTQDQQNQSYSQKPIKSNTKIQNTQLIFPSVSTSIAIKAISLSIHVLNLLRHELSQDLEQRIRKQQSKMQHDFIKKLCIKQDNERKIFKLVQSQTQINGLKKILVDLKRKTQESFQRYNEQQYHEQSLNPNLQFKDLTLKQLYNQVKHVFKKIEKYSMGPQLTY